LDDQGTIVVAAAAVDGSSTLMVTAHDGERVRAAVGGTDAATGITVLTASGIRGTPVDAAAADASAGEAVAVLSAGSTATASVRSVDVRTTVGGTVLHDAVQLDRAVPDDAIGAAVVDGDGTLLGIVLASSGDQGLAVVVPADDAIAAARGLRDDGEVRRAWLGVRAVDLSPEAAKLMAVDGGAQLTMVQAGSPAAAAGLRKGDVVTGVDDQPVGDASDLVVQLRHHRPGDDVAVHWQRGVETGQTEVELGG
jgi:S1-C subfamily serine protease